MKRLLAVFVALFTVGAISQSGAQTYPVKPIRMIVPYAAGGGPDLFVRVVTQKMSESLGQQIIIENRVGASGNIGMAIGAKAPPDGYTLVTTFTGTMAISPHIFREPGFDPFKDFVPISIGTMQPEVFAVSPKVPAKTLQELVALARAQPGKLTCGTSGVTSQLVVEVFKQLNQVDVLHVRYQGGAPQALKDLIGGFIECAVTSNAAAAPHHKSGRIKVIAALGPDRTSILPDVPSSVEAGMPGLRMVIWYGIVAPAGTPRDIVQRLNLEMNRALEAPEVKDRLTKAGLTPRGTTVEEFAATIRRDYEQFGKAVKDTNMKID